jgi:hypothetical protein
VDERDVGVAQACHRPRLAQHARADLVAGRAAREVAVQELDRQRAVDLRVVRLVDGAHPAAPEQADDHVAADQLAARELDLERRVIDLLGVGREIGRRHARGPLEGGALKDTRARAGHLRKDQRGRRSGRAGSRRRTTLTPFVSPTSASPSPTQDDSTN